MNESAKLIIQQYQQWLADTQLQLASAIAENTAAQARITELEAATADEPNN